MTVYNNEGPPNPTLTDQKQVRKLDDDLYRYLNELNENLASLLNTGLRFVDNFDAVFVSGTSHVTPDTETGFTHTLGKIPSGFIVTSLSKGATLYNGVTSNSKTTIYVRSTLTATAFTILVF